MAGYRNGVTHIFRLLRTVFVLLLSIDTAKSMLRKGKVWWENHHLNHDASSKYHSSHLELTTPSKMQVKSRKKPTKHGSDSSKRASDASTSFKVHYDSPRVFWTHHPLYDLNGPESKLHVSPVRNFGGDSLSVVSSPKSPLKRSIDHLTMSADDEMKHEEEEVVRTCAYFKSKGVGHMEEKTTSSEKRTKQRDALQSVCAARKTYATASRDPGTDMLKAAQHFTTDVMAVIDDMWTHDVVENGKIFTEEEIIALKDADIFITGSASRGEMSLFSDIELVMLCTAEDSTCEKAVKGLKNNLARAGIEMDRLNIPSFHRGTIANSANILGENLLFSSEEVMTTNGLEITNDRRIRWLLQSGDTASLQSPSSQERSHASLYSSILEMAKLAVETSLDVKGVYSKRFHLKHEKFIKHMKQIDIRRNRHVWRYVHERMEQWKMKSAPTRLETLQVALDKTKGDLSLHLKRDVYRPIQQSILLFTTALDGSVGAQEGLFAEIPSMSSNLILKSLATRWSGKKELVVVVDSMRRALQFSIRMRTISHFSHSKEADSVVIKQCSSEATSDKGDGTAVGAETKDESEAEKLAAGFGGAESHCFIGPGKSCTLGCEHRAKAMRTLRVTKALLDFWWEVSEQRRMFEQESKTMGAAPDSVLFRADGGVYEDKFLAMLQTHVLGVLD